MKHLTLALAVVCIFSSQSSADDKSHPYYPSITSAHSSLAPDSPKWFRPGYGYATPYSQIPQRSVVPYLSLQADTPFKPYTFREVKTPRRTPRIYNRAGRVWPVPGDAKGIQTDALRHYGNLPVNTGFAR